MKKLLGFSIFLVFVLIASLTAEAKVTLPAIFSDNMVLQQNTHANIHTFLLSANLKKR